MVYVDPVFTTEPNSKWPFKAACHMMADSVDELHLFAERLGLKREWFQSKSLPHYDLTPGKRRSAIRLGAIALNLHQTAALIIEMKMLGKIILEPEKT